MHLNLTGKIRKSSWYLMEQARNPECRKLPDPDMTVGVIKNKKRPICGSHPVHEQVSHILFTLGQR